MSTQNRVLIIRVGGGEAAVGRGEAEEEKGPEGGGKRCGIAQGLRP